MANRQPKEEILTPMLDAYPAVVLEPSTAEIFPPTSAAPFGLVCAGTTKADGIPSVVIALRSREGVTYAGLLTSAMAARFRRALDDAIEQTTR